MCVCRFTSFLAGKAHITAQEQVDYEWHDGGLDSTSESENESLTNRDNISSQHTAHNSPHRYCTCVYTLFNVLSLSLSDTGLPVALGLVSLDP